MKRVLSRREALLRMSAFAGGTGLPLGYTVASDIPAPTVAWQVPDLAPLDAPGYGADPDLIHPSIPWPNTLGDSQRHLLARICDILLPADTTMPSASALGVVDVIDEWVSAPYPRQHEDRLVLLAGLDWCDQEAQRRHQMLFNQLPEDQATRIIADIADADTLASAALAGPALFLDKLRALAVSVYYASPEGMRAVGYMGNVPIAGPYPGPSEAAMAHLEGVLDKLGLTMPTELNTDQKSEEA